MKAFTLGEAFLTFGQISLCRRSFRATKPFTTFQRGKTMANAIIVIYPLLKWG